MPSDSTILVHVYIQDIQFSSAIKRLTNTFPSIHAFSYPFRLQLLASPEVEPSFFKNFPPTQRLILPKIQKILQRFECVNDYTSCRTASACRKFNKALTIRRKYTQRCTWKRWHFAEWRTYWRKSYGWRGHKKVEYLSADRFPFHVFFFFAKVMRKQWKYKSEVLSIQVKTKTTANYTLCSEIFIASGMKASLKIVTCYSLKCKNVVLSLWPSLLVHRS